MWPRVRLLEEGQEVLALAVDFAGRAGMVEGDDLPQRRVELLAGSGIFVVK